MPKLVVNKQLNFAPFKDIIISWAMGIGLILILSFAIGILTIGMGKALFAML